MNKKKKNQTVEGPDEKKILSVTNAVYFFISNACIIVEENDFRLIVIQDKKALLNNTYDTLRGAKIAFNKYFKSSGYKEDLKPNWSHPYPPDLEWLGNKLLKPVNQMTEFFGFHTNI